MTTDPTLIGTYTPPPARVGARVYCRFRRAWCKVTSWTDAPISWSRVQVPGQRGGCGLLVNATLQRAIRTEIAAALKHFFGVRDTTVWRWRKWLGVGGHTRTRGSRRLHAENSEQGTAAMKVKEWTDAECDAKSEAAKRVGLTPPNRWAATGWTQAELALLGTGSDEAVAIKIGRTRSAVRSRRVRASVPPAP